MIYVLFNPLSNNKKGQMAKERLELIFKNEELSFTDILSIDDYKKFFKKIKKTDLLILCGGDGTLNRFVNDTHDIPKKCSLYFFPQGSGNDFARDTENLIEKENGLIPLNDFIKDLPQVSVNGIKKYFLNGIGYGIDGYCCQEGDEERIKSNKPVNYTLIAVKGLFFGFHPSNAKVTVDGRTYEFKHVWLAPSMLGKYYGGGMKVAPDQNRLNSEKKLTLVVWHKSRKLKTLLSFPKIFTGEHVNCKNMISIFTGHNITVEFDRAQALQIDGDTVKNVTSYSVSFE